MRTKLKGLSAVAILAFSFLFTIFPTAMSYAQNSNAVRMLTDTELWGEDFQQFLISLPAWATTNEEKVAVFPKVAVSTAMHKQEETKQKVELINRTIRTSKSKLRPQFKVLLKKVQKQVPTLEARAFAIPNSSETQIQLFDASSQFLAPDLTIDFVRNKYGEPEAVTQQITEDGKGHRPLIKTSYQYAEATIFFITTDWDSNPNKINRVEFDVQKVNALVFR
ncbi:MAG: hypothetical protein DHS20C18_28960 [Saprospiraceae bacterium]|nr:MAG: hypothetical protein DHS20C18_28960 [Saprospiraceae bacterium]